MDATEARNHAAITVEQEGFGYAVQDYASPSLYRSDPKLALMWATAAMSLHNLETYLFKNAGEQSELMDRTDDMKRVEDEFMDLMEERVSDKGDIK